MTWTADGDITRYKSAPAQAVAGATTIIWENSEATGNTLGMPHTLTFDTSTEGYNHDVTLNILASPFDANNGRHQATVTLTPAATVTSARSPVTARWSVSWWSPRAAEVATPRRRRSPPPWRATATRTATTSARPR
ncbi:hypothetical protein NKG94_14785 [Micromonospora sp. M12]